MNLVLPINEVEDIKSVSESFKKLLERDDNSDIAREFPNTTRLYTGDLERSLASLEADKEHYEPGKTEKFIVFAGEQAVGLSVVTNDIATPYGVDSAWPNLSGFVCNPFRGQGLGRLSIATRMKVVRSRFDDHAWTTVREDNFPSIALVTSVGFVKFETEARVRDGYSLYLFDGAIEDK